MMRAWLTTATEIGMLAYWLLAGALALGLVTIDPSLMYSDYQNPLVVAWNWSFLPVDVAFALTGLAARFASPPPAIRFRLAIISAVLMLCAGLMAVSYWTIRGEFSPAWWALNIWLIILGLLNLMLARPVPDAPG